MRAEYRDHLGKADVLLWFDFVDGLSTFSDFHAAPPLYLDSLTDIP